MAPSYNPDTKLFYFAVREQCDVFYSSPPVYKKGQVYWGTAFRADTKEKSVWDAKGHGSYHWQDPMGFSLLSASLGGNAFHLRRPCLLRR